MLSASSPPDTIISVAMITGANPAGAYCKFGPSSKAHSVIAPMLPFHQSAALCDSNQKPTLLSHRFEALFICCTYNTLLKVICQLFFQICYHVLREGIMSYFIPAGACRGHLPVSS